MHKILTCTRFCSKQDKESFHSVSFFHQNPPKNANQSPQLQDSKWCWCWVGVFLSIYISFLFPFYLHFYFLSRPRLQKTCAVLPVHRRPVKTVALFQTPWKSRTSKMRIEQEKWKSGLRGGPDVCVRDLAFYIWIAPDGECHGLPKTSLQCANSL